MSFVFLCSCLEPARDGVGDYTRRLAGEVIRQGHRAAIIAINDRHVTCSDATDETKRDENQNRQNSHVGVGLNDMESQASDGTEIPVLRLSRTIPWSDRIQLAKQFVDAENPDWLSLQFVPYAYHPKGMPFGLSSRLATLGIGRTWHVMFHELWVGLGVSPPLKHRILQCFQRKVVQSLFRKLEPRVVHAQSTPYVELLGKYFPNVDLLPLFSSIPVLGDRKENENRCILRFVFFGSVHGGWDIKRNVSVIQSAAKFYGKRAVLIAIGGGGGLAKETWDAFRKLGVEVLETGRLDVNQVSNELSAADFGLSASVPDLIQKSSSAAAMFEHGLPVLITGKPIWGDRFLDTIRESCPLAIFGGDLASPQNAKRRKAKPSSVFDVARKFISAVELSSHQ